MPCGQRPEGAVTNLWESSAVERFSAPPLEDDISADLAVIGGGYTGLSAALHAAEGGARVVLLEAERIGAGGSGRNVGLVNAGLWLPPEDIVAALGETEGRALNAALGQGPDRVFELVERHGIACEPTRAGTLHCAHAPAAMADLRRRHDQGRAAGAPVTLLDASEAQARTGSAAVHGALHDARAGTIQPLAYARGLARAAAEAGARLHEGAQVTETEYENGIWRLVTGSGGRVRARHLLFATNGYHRPPRGGALPRVATLHFFQLATEPLPEDRIAEILPAGEGAWDTGTVMTAFRRDAAGRLILGGMGRPEGLARRLHLGWARRKLAALFPALAGVSFAHEWTGRIAVTDDHAPKVLRTGRNALAVFGYSGRGIAPGTVLGRAAAEALLEDRPDALPLAPRDAYADRTPGLRSAIYDAGAAAWHLLAAR
ncbi:FAD-dependent oxidoreductase [Rhodosalinus halophilus]|uniref:FAD-dependent oxidoreductase n=1 Tax=Rhodosalinus halophilus TaxID=2259333 RepID=A0A365U887_9RHOB|nr:FAD-binding oxidoreductase [Rhodosalinus halophilus]RBI85036.1 FAD-dependent oxidoreductase [Rhodosalinus halophilus]